MTDTTTEREDNRLLDHGETFKVNGTEMEVVGVGYSVDETDTRVNFNYTIVTHEQAVAERQRVADEEAAIEKQRKEAEKAAKDQEG